MRISKYTPPELIWHYLPGLRDVNAGRWLHVLQQLGKKYDNETLVTIIASRHDKRLTARPIPNYSNAFDLLKAFAMLNLVLFAIVFIAEGRATGNILLAALFAFAAGVTALLDIYHRCIHSRWAIDEILNELIVDNAAQKDESVPSHFTHEEHEDIKIFLAARRAPVVTLGWSLPLIGNMRVLAESLRRK